MVTKLIISRARIQIRQHVSRVLLITVVYHLSDSSSNNFIMARLLKAFDPKLLGIFLHLENQRFPQK